MKDASLLTRTLYATVAASLFLGGLSMIPGFISGDGEAMRMMFMMGALAPFALVLTSLLIVVPIYILFHGFGSRMSSSPHLIPMLTGSAVGLLVAITAAANGLIPATVAGGIVGACAAIGYVLSGAAKKHSTGS